MRRSASLCRRSGAASLPNSQTRTCISTFAVIAEDRGGYTHEPLAYPGGRIFVPAPLILAAGDEAEFAGMLAHAMANLVR